MIALYRFWPEARAAVRAAVAAPAPASPSPAALPLPALATTLGAYDLAVDLGEASSAGEAASRALAVAEAAAGGRLGRTASGWLAAADPPAIPIPAPEPDVFRDLPPAIPLLLLRAKGGWNLLASPDRETWLTLSMTFLNRRTYQRFDTEGAWFSPDVNELASLVIGTHNTQDVEGTCLTYGIPGLSLVDWEDETQAALLEEAGDPEAARSALLAEELHYAALLGSPALSLREALAPLAADLFVEEEETPRSA